VRATLAALGPSRIGHGARSIEDAALVEQLRRDGIHLEICPSSNVQTNLCATYADHPVERLRRAGVSLGISSDCRTVTDITLAQEYARLRSTFAWTARELLASNLAAIEASFATPDVKARVRERLHAGYAAAGMDGAV
jgi:adenosine deaminase